MYKSEELFPDIYVQVFPQNVSRCLNYTSKANKKSEFNDPDCIQEQIHEPQRDGENIFILFWGENLILDLLIATKILEYIMTCF